MSIIDKLGGSGWQGAEAGCYLTAAQRRAVVKVLTDVAEYGKQHKCHGRRSTTVPELRNRALAAIEVIRGAR